MFHAESEGRRRFAKLCDEAKRQAASKLRASPQASFDQIIDRVKDLANDRNDTVHALWTTDTSGHPHRIRPSLNKATKSVDWDQSRIVDVAELRQKRLEMERALPDVETERRSWT